MRDLSTVLLSDRPAHAWLETGKNNYKGNYSMTYIERFPPTVSRLPVERNDLGPAFEEGTAGLRPRH